MKEITLYICPDMVFDCPHYDPENKACRVALDIGKSPTEYMRCECYEPTDTPIEKEI